MLFVSWTLYNITKLRKDNFKQRFIGRRWKEKYDARMGITNAA